MRKTILTLSTIFIMAVTYSQSKQTFRDPSLGFGFFLKDFVTPVNIHNNSFGHVLSKGDYGKISDMTLGIHANYFQGITSHLDFGAFLGGTFTKYGYSPKYLSTQEDFALDLKAHVNLKLLSDKALINPYLTAGLGLAEFKANYLFGSINYGSGFEVNIGNGAFIYIQAVYDNVLTHKNVDNLNYSIGYAAPLPKKEKAAKVIAPIQVPPTPPAPVVVKDTDGDGIPDNKDKCPSIAGIEKYNGCPIPDTDGDGINDELDSCPKVPGLARYNGCPIPDTDKDGVNDEQDSCPNVAGLVRYHGCPVPDTDGDGINDDLDKCPTVKGTKENSGCPEMQKKMNELAKSVYFKSGASKISSKVYKTIDEVIVVLKANPTLKLSIEGHTDNTGTESVNKDLSQERADAIVSYLKKKGIDSKRLIAKGYGSEKPVANNKTEAGKAKNRRVELKATY